MVKSQREYNNQGLPDSLQCVKKLEAAGFTRAQAEAQAETFLTILKELVTKKDLKETIRETKSELTQEIKAVEFKLSQEIKAVDSKLSQEIKAVDFKVNQEIKVIEFKIEVLRRDLKIWFGGSLASLVLVLSGITTFLAHLIH